MFIISWTRN